MCLNGPLGMKRGRGMRLEYSTTGARKQEGLGGQGLSIGGFLSGRDYQIRFGVLEKGLIVPSNTKADVVDVLIKIIVVPTHRNPTPVFRG